MKFIFKEKDEDKIKLLSKILALSEVIKVLRKKSRIKTIEVSIVNYEISLSFQGFKDEICIIAISRDDRNNFLYKRDNLIFYYINNKIEINNLLCKQILFTIFDNLIKSPQSLKVVDNILNEDSISIEIERQTNFITYKKDLDIFEAINLWPELILEKIIYGSYKRLVTMVKDNKDEIFIIKIYYYSKNEQFKHLINNIYLINEINKYVNTSRIIDYKKFFNAYNNNKFFLIRYEYLENDGQFNASNIELLAEQLVKLHSLKVNNEKLNKTDILNALFEIYREETDKKIRKEIPRYLNCLNSRNNIKGICHNDLKLEHIISSGERIFLIDFDEMCY